MNKQSIAIIISAFMILTLVSAGIFESVSNMDKTSELDKVYRDKLLTLTTDKDIKPIIEIDCNEEQCKYSATQSGIINSYDNMIERKYCSEFNQTDNSCLTYSTYTVAEIETMVSEQVTSRLENFANASIERDAKAFDKASEGTISVVEKK